jgi:uncharacterized protein (TIGR03435 family)
MTGSFVVSLLVAVTATAGLALVAASIAGRSRAAVRHLVLAAAVGVLAMLPVAATMPISIPVAVPAASASAEFVAPAVDVINDFVSNASPSASRATSSSGAETPAPSGLAAGIAVVWIVGAIASVVPLLIGLVQIRGLCRSGLPWMVGGRVAGELARQLRVDRPIDVLRHESVAGPMTCGLLRPAILLPMDVEQWRAEDLERAFVHELEHVRRQDWIVHCGARVVCAAYWFHPLVWILRAKLGLEAERACDDAVLARTEAVAYADQLVDFAKRLSAGRHQPLLAMAHRRDLSTRVRALLDGRQARGRVGVATIAVATVVAAILVVTISPFRLVARATSEQATDPAATAWEVASIRPCDPSAQPAGGRAGGPGGGGRTIEVAPGRLILNCLTFAGLVNIAYVENGNPPPVNYLQPLTADEVNQSVKGVPDWARTEKFTIEAKAVGEPPRSAMLGPMLRALLADRFKLALHQDLSSVSAYALRVADGGLKMQPVASDSCIQSDPAHPGPRVKRINAAGQPEVVDPGAPADAKPYCTGGVGLSPDRSRMTYDATGARLDQVARTMMGFLLDRPVVNETGLQGQFTFHLEFAPDANVRTMPVPPGSAPPPMDPAGPNLFSVLQKQLGLKLVPTKAEQGHLVVDHVERPSAGQSMAPAAAPQRFEAVSIRPCQDDTPPPGPGAGQRSSQGGFPKISPGHFTIDCGTVERLISNAYVLNGDRLTNNDARIGDVSWWKGGPEWIRYDKFSIEASAPGVTDRSVLLGPMLRALLEDRFKLRLRREIQDAPMYAMTIAKSGLKIQPIGPDGCGEFRDQLNDPAAVRANAQAITAGTAKPNCGGMTMMGGPGHSRWTIGGTSLPNFAHTLSTSMDHYVVDRTGASPDTTYNIHLEFAPDEHTPGADKRNPRTTFDPPDAPNIFAALEQQLGLKLDATKGPQGVLVIDHVERPRPDGPITVPQRAKGAGR